MAVSMQSRGEAPQSFYYWDVGDRMVEKGRPSTAGNHKQLLGCAVLWLFCNCALKHQSTGGLQRNQCAIQCWLGSGRNWSFLAQTCSQNNLHMLPIGTYLSSGVSTMWFWAALVPESAIGSILPFHSMH
eukprot:jgi/Ulvmu1/8934/UM005_0025.1